MQIHVPFLKTGHDCQEFLITNTIVAFRRGHFFRQECNRIQNTTGFRLCRVRVSLRQDTRYHIIGDIRFKDCLKLRVEVFQDRSCTELASHSPGSTGRAVFLVLRRINRFGRGSSTTIRASGRDDSGQSQVTVKDCLSKVHTYK